MPMNEFEEIMAKYPQLSLEFDDMPNGLCGLIIGDSITISKSISHEEQLQWLYEEIGHWKTSVNDISDYQSKNNRCQEHVARVWGMKQQLSPETLAKFSKQNVESDYEVANELGVRVNYLHEVGSIYGYQYKHLSY
jgi:hypothetical protein